MWVLRCAYCFVFMLLECFIFYFVAFLLYPSLFVAPVSGKLLLGFGMRDWISLYPFVKRLNPSGTHFHTDRQSDVGWDAWNSISFFSLQANMGFGEGSCSTLSKILWGKTWVQLTSLTHFPSTAKGCSLKWIFLFLMMILHPSGVMHLVDKTTEINLLASWFCAYSCFHFHFLTNEMYSLVSQWNW